jgi:hypothetical protein
MSRTLKFPSAVCAVLALAGLVLMFTAAAALAHHLASGTATCTGATANYSGFSENNKPITWRVLSDNVQVAAGTGTFVGENGTLSATYPALTAGDHTVKWESTWPGQGEEVGGFTQTVTGCVSEQAPPLPTPPTATPPAATPPVQVVTPAKPVVQPKKKVTKKQRTAKCKHGVRRFDRHGHRLRDSKGHRIALCGPAPKRTGSLQSPSFTG